MTGQAYTMLTAIIFLWLGGLLGGLLVLLWLVCDRKDKL